MVVKVAFLVEFSVAIVVEFSVAFVVEPLAAEQEVAPAAVQENPHDLLDSSPSAQGSMVSHAMVISTVTLTLSVLGRSNGL